VSKGECKIFLRLYNIFAVLCVIVLLLSWIDFFGILPTSAPL